MHIGLIGGIGPAATDFFYRRIIAAFASRKLPFTSFSPAAWSPPVPIASSVAASHGPLLQWHLHRRRYSSARSGPRRRPQHFVAVAASRLVTVAQRVVIESATAKLLHEDCTEAILLGGIDLALAFAEASATFPTIERAAIHVDPIVNWISPR